MKITQTKTAIDIINSLLDDLNYLESKWEIYQKKGFLFKTNSFKKARTDFNKTIRQIEQTNNILEKIFKESHGNLNIDDILNTTPLPESNIHEKYAYLIEEPSYHDKTIGSFDAVNVEEEQYDLNDFLQLKEIIFHEPINPEELNQLLEIKSEYIHKISNIKKNTYIEVEKISDFINALDFNIRKRLIGFDTTEIGTELDTRSFGNIQIIYDSAETLMFDYTKSIKGINEKYNGQIVFGFRNRAVCYPNFDVVVIPSYTEFQLQYLSILAHESYHFVENSINKETKNELNKIKFKMFDILEPISQIWYDQSIDINVNSIKTERLADEILADIFAICIGGDAYYYTLNKFCIPILFDLNIMETDVHLSKYLNSGFSISSLRSRICNSAYNYTCGKYNKQYDYDKDKTLIEKWETLSCNINRHFILKDSKYSKSNILNDINFYSEYIKNIEKEISEKKIYSSMLDLITDKYFSEDDAEIIAHNLYDIEDSESLVNLFSGTPSVHQLNQIWDDYTWLKPRHILSMYVLYDEEINRNALLFSLGNHSYIKNRYQ